jgi:MSHA biogenesis protein MshQ
MKDATTGNPVLATGIRGGTGTFVSRPANFTVSSIMRTSTGFANPAASTASGTVFLPAGQPFSATVTAVESGGMATPNFGKETPPESVRFSTLLILPSGGDASSVGGVFGAFAAGSATGTSFTWLEVGIVSLVPRMFDGDYLGAGDVVGTATGNVGRFIPNAFGVALNTPVWSTGCSSGGFTYIGQPATYMAALSPVITVTALALGGTTTSNYTGAFFRLSNTTLTGRTYTPSPASPALDISRLPATSVDPAIADGGAGQSTLTFSAGTGIAFVRGTPIAPLIANIALSINIIDQDGVTAPNPVTFGAVSGMAWSSGTNQYYGRLAITNALGSELLDLPMPLRMQYYLGTAQGFITNTADGCTATPVIAFSSYQVKLAAGDTCVRDSGNPGASGIGCAVAGGAKAIRSTALAGDFNLFLAAPGSGDNGAMTVTATAPAWLQYLWSAASGSNSSPTSQATFGVFPGSPARIYQREVY